MIHNLEEHHTQESIVREQIDSSPELLQPFRECISHSLKPISQQAGGADQVNRQYMSQLTQDNIESNEETSLAGLESTFEVPLKKGHAKSYSEIGSRLISKGISPIFVSEIMDQVKKQRSPLIPQQQSNISGFDTNYSQTSIDEEEEDNDEKIDHTRKCIQYDQEIEEEDDVFEIRPKANSFSQGYISTMIPCEQKKSQFGMRLNLNFKGGYQINDSEAENESSFVDDSKEYYSTEEVSSSSSITPLNTRSDFASRRSKFFTSIKQESLTLIALTPKKQGIIKGIEQPSFNRDKFEEKFTLHEKIGQGCHAVVKRCTKKEETSILSYAVKIIAYKDQEYLFEILQEERVMSLLKHRNIIRHDSFYLEKEKKRAYIVSEFADGYPLSHYFQQKNTLSSWEIRSIAKQILRGVSHMHSKGVIHRDLSFNNIMYDRYTETIKIIDFTVSKIVTIQKLLTNTGTLNFKAPEMLSGTFYSHAIDLWAVGVNIFALIFGFLPFDCSENNQKMVINNILTKNPFGDIRDNYQCDPLLLSFLEGLLERNPLKRMTALQALKHPWINQKISGNDFRSKNNNLKNQKGFRSKKQSASTAADLDQEDTNYRNEENSTNSPKSFNYFIIKTLVNLQDD